MAIIDLLKTRPLTYRRNDAQAPSQRTGRPGPGLGHPVELHVEPAGLEAGGSQVVGERAQVVRAEPVEQIHGRHILKFGFPGRRGLVSGTRAV